MAGIVIFLTFPAYIPGSALIAILPVFSTVLFFIGRQAGYSYRWAGGIIIHVFFIFSGFGLSMTHSEMRKTPGKNIDVTLSGTYIIELTEPASERVNSVRLMAKGLYARYDSVWMPAEAKMLFYLEKDSAGLSLDYGDRLMVRSRIREIPAPLNPGEFDYRSFLESKGIYFQGYAKKTDWELLDKGHGNLVKSFGFSARSYLLSVLERKNLGAREYAVASAILLGYDEILDPETKSAFSSSGAMHILCISGLHVGIIYVIISNILRFLNKTSRLRIIKTIILLLVLWLYALITGFSPSVQRAAAMFSFILIGQSLGRNISAFNSLAASAFFLLLANPFILREVGFQLSYFAVAGILVVYPMISKIYSPRNVILKQVWGITCVSIAATLFTFPLGLLYFHQFPNLFLFTNLLAIPASVVIIYSGLLTFMTSALPVITDIISTALSLTIQGLHLSVSFIEDLPFSTLRGVWISGTEALLIFVLISGFLIWAQKFSISAIKLILIPAILINLSFILDKNKTLSDSRIVVYNVRNSTALDFISGDSHVFLADSALLTDKRKLDYHIRNHWWMHGIKRPSLMGLSSDTSGAFFCKSGDYVQFCDHKLLLINGKDKTCFPNGEVTVETVILSNEPDVTLSALMNLKGFRTLILDSSNSARFCDKMIEESSGQGIECLCVEEGKALQIKI